MTFFGKSSYQYQHIFIQFSNFNASNRQTKKNNLLSIKISPKWPTIFLSGNKKKMLRQSIMPAAEAPTTSPHVVTEKYSNRTPQTVSSFECTFFCFYLFSQPSYSKKKVFFPTSILDWQTILYISLSLSLTHTGKVPSATWLEFSKNK